MTRVAASDVYTDFNGLNRLKHQAGQDAKAALPEVAKQFEALFVQMAMKNMRQAGAPLESELTNSDQTRFYRDMYDQQMALHLSRSGGLGLAKTLESQLGGALQGAKASKEVAGKTLNEYRQAPMRSVGGEGGMAQRSAVEAGDAAGGAAPRGFANRKEFINRLMPHAEAAAAELGIDPSVLLAQAALETGWGRSIIKRADGTPSFNLFGIKAGSRWDGKRAGVKTLEYVQGVPVRKAASFRAYDSYAESFADYVRFLKENPRYAQALANADDSAAYVRELQKAGYATDPRYANKILAIARRTESLYDAPVVADVAGAAPSA
jgi:flagellar protein FlgJ